MLFLLWLLVLILRGEGGLFFFLSFFLHGDKSQYQVSRDRLNEVAHNGVPIDVRGRNDHRRTGLWW